MIERVFYVIILIHHEPNLASWFGSVRSQYWKTNNYQALKTVDTLIPRNPIVMPINRISIVKAQEEPGQPRLYRYINEPVTQRNKPGWIYRVTTRDLQLVDASSNISHIV